MHLDLHKECEQHYNDDLYQCGGFEYWDKQSEAMKYKNIAKRISISIFVWIFVTAVVIGIIMSAVTGDGELVTQYGVSGVLIGLVTSSAYKCGANRVINTYLNNLDRVSVIEVDDEC